jgi:hypothetical protein
MRFSEVFWLTAVHWVCCIGKLRKMRRGTKVGEAQALPSLDGFGSVEFDRNEE